MVPFAIKGLQGGAQAHALCDINYYNCLFVFFATNLIVWN